MSTIIAKVDRDTAMASVCMILSKAVIYGDKFDFDYTDGVLTLEYEPNTDRKAWITNHFEE